VHNQLVGIHRARTGARTYPKRIEGRKCIGSQLNPRTDLAELMSLLENLDRETSARKRQSRRQAPDSTTRDEDWPI
jgi:hypothetical protein